MSWLPDAPSLIILLRRIEKGEDPLQNAVELFWLFCMKSLSPDEFRSCVLFWIDSHLRDSPKGGGFIDQDVRNIILQGPEKATEVIVGRLDALCQMKRVPYIADEFGDQESLYVSTLIESSRLTRLLKTDGYSDKTREVLSRALNNFARFKISETNSQNPRWQKEYSAIIEAVATFLYITQFLIRKSDGEYEDSLKSFAQGIESLKIMATSRRFNILQTGINPSVVNFMNYVANYQELPWIRSIKPQVTVDCFEALRTGERIREPKQIAAICGLLATAYNDLWVLDGDENEVKNTEGNNLNVIDFWRRASWWCEAKLQPSDLRELLNEREDSASEKRLRTYFFGGGVWDKLPRRVQSCLISADRDLFGGNVARKEAIFNELRIATEELLDNRLWKPLDQWIQIQKKSDSDIKWFTDRKQELSRKGSRPTLLDFEKICKLSITDAFLKEIGISNDKRNWFRDQLPKTIYRLRRARNRAEHESTDQWTRQELNEFYNEFMGIGRPGILPELCGILLFRNAE